MFTRLRGLTAFLAFIGFMFVTAAPAGSSPAESIVFFSVSVVHPKTQKLIPLKIYYNGRFTLDRKLRIPHGSTLYVKVRAPQGRYLSAVFRDDSAQIFDLPQSARRLNSDTKEFTWTMPRRFVPGRVEFYLCLWAAFNPENNKNEGALERSGWISLGDTAF